MKSRKIRPIGAAIVTAFLAGTALADEDRIQVLEKQMAEANAEIAALKGRQMDLATMDAPESKLHFGGYGEFHANFAESGSDTFDIHRLVMYVGYDINDWIKLSSEVELEHAYVADGSGGEISIEQLYADFLLTDAVNIRAGRILAPLGIINQHHEPTLFNGVERPNVEKYIIPSTWSLDGIGLFGYPLSWLSYEVYGVAGLDDTGFSANEGIRGGRMKERQGLNDPALSGRLNMFPLESDQQDLRIGLSGYYGGTNNKNKGGVNTNDSGNTFSMVSADFEYSVSRLSLRGVAAHGTNSDADQLAAAGVGEEIFGWYLESGLSIMPKSWKTGKMQESDLIPFVRYERYDTQYKVPSGTIKSDSNDRTDITVGVNWLLTRNFVVKADVQFLRNEAIGWDVGNKYNLGMGWVFQ